MPNPSLPGGVTSPQVARGDSPCGPKGRAPSAQANGLGSRHPHQATRPFRPRYTCSAALQAAIVTPRVPRPLAWAEGARAVGPQGWLCGGLGGLGGLGVKNLRFTLGNSKAAKGRQLATFGGLWRPPVRYFSRFTIFS